MVSPPGGHVAAAFARTFRIEHVLLVNDASNCAEAAGTTALSDGLCDELPFLLEPQRLDDSVGHELAHVGAVLGGFIPCPHGTFGGFRDQSMQT